MELLRQGDISAGRTAELLGVNRSRLSELMNEYGISPFDDTMTLEDLQREVAEYFNDFSVLFLRRTQVDTDITQVDFLWACCFGRGI